MRKANWVLAVAVALTVSACGGGGDDANELGENVFEGIGQASGDVESGDGGSSGGTEIGPVTQTADPGTGWVEVEGQRYEFDAFGSIHHNCELLDDRITINFQQTRSGSDFTLQGGLVNGQWNANLTFVPNAEEQISYGANVGFDPGTLGIGGSEMSYEGTVRRVEDFDIQNAQEVQATVAINCNAPDGGTTAEIGGQSFTFPLSGAQSLDCVVSDEDIDVLLSHNNPERKQLQVESLDIDGEQTLFVHVTTDAGQYDSSGTDFSIDGAALTYEGVFTTPDGGEAEGSVSVVCG